MYAFGGTVGICGSGLLPLNLFILKEARLATYRFRILNHWRGSSRGIVHSLIVDEVLNYSVLDMTSWRQSTSLHIFAQFKMESDLSVEIPASPENGWCG